MTHHSELLNYLAEQYNLKTYLEIGTFNRDHNFNKIEMKDKLCVDPDPDAKADIVLTSDEFFAGNELVPDDWYGRKFDLIFIDGLHHADQVKRDFDNALKILNNPGFIVMHDCNPHSEHITHVPRDNGEWCGDVYKFAAKLLEYEKIQFLTVDFDYGCTVVWVDKYIGPDEVTEEITWEYFDKNRSDLLRLVSVDEFKSIMRMIYPLYRVKILGSPFYTR